MYAIPGSKRNTLLYFMTYCGICMQAGPLRIITQQFSDLDNVIGKQVFLINHKLLFTSHWKKISSMLE